MKQLNKFVRKQKQYLQNLHKTDYNNHFKFCMFSKVNYFLINANSHFYSTR